MKEVGNINWTEKKLLVFIIEYGMRVVECRFRENIFHEFTWISMQVLYTYIHIIWSCHISNYIQYSSEVFCKKGKSFFRFNNMQSIFREFKDCFHLLKLSKDIIWINWIKLDFGVLDLILNGNPIHLVSPNY